MAGFARNAIFAALAAAALITPAHAQNASQAQELSNCAGAVSAFSGIRVETVYPSGRPQAVEYGWPAILSAISHRLSREPGVEGATGLVAAQAARSYWVTQPRTEQGRVAEECRAQFSPEVTPQ